MDNMRPFTFFVYYCFLFYYSNGLMIVMEAYLLRFGEQKHLSADTAHNAEQETHHKLLRFLTLAYDGNKEKGKKGHQGFFSVPAEAVPRTTG